MRLEDPSTEGLLDELLPRPDLGDFSLRPALGGLLEMLRRFFL